MAQDPGRTRVLIAAHSLDRPEFALVRGLAARGIDLKLVANPAEAQASELKNAGVQLTQTDLHRGGAASIAALRAAIADHRPEVLHAFTSRTLHAVRKAAPQRDAKLVYYRGKVEYPRRWHPGDRRKYFGPLVDRIVCVSDAVARALVESGVEPRRVRTIRKAHDPAWYAVPPADLRAELKLDPSRFVVAVVANMRREKGSNEVIDAARLLAERGSPVAWALIGRDQRNAFDRWYRPAQRSGYLYALGGRSDVVNLLHSASCVVNASFTEGLPKAVIEAMLCRAPVVATAVGGTTELIQDGATGLLVPPGSPVAIADAVELLHADAALARRLADEAYRFAATTLSVDGMVEATIDLYREVLAEA